MTLPAPVLDDRTFQDIVDEAKTLIPRYCPEWTNHNVSDPGVTLIELFAWMTEMTLYRLNQLPDRLYTKLLELVGLELFPATAARTDLTFWLSTARSPTTVTIPAGTEVGTLPGRDGASVVFTTDAELEIVTPRIVAFLTRHDRGRYIDHTEDLKRREGILCFSERPRTGDAFYVGFRQSLAGHALRLAVNASIEGLGVRPERPPLRWEAWSADDEDWVPARNHGDDTGGLNRNGTVTLLLPPSHDPLSLGPVREPAYWLRARIDDPDEDEQRYESSPRIRRLRAFSVGGTVSAHHCRRAPAEVLGRSDGLPGQTFAVRYTPLLPWQSSDRVRVVSGETTTRWKVVDDFGRSRASDKHVVWDASAGELRFGPLIRHPDGSSRQHGAVPPKGAEIRVTGYRFGGGVQGNVGAQTLTVMRTTFPLVDSVENLVAAEGGTEPETVENAKLRAPGTLRSGYRAVTAADYEHLTRQVPGVARVRAVKGDRPGEVWVLVVPQTDHDPVQRQLDDLALSDTLRADVETLLDERRPLGTSVVVDVPEYQGITVACRVRQDPNRSPSDVRSRAVQALYRFFDPLVGGPEGTGWRFGEDAETAPIFGLLQGVDGIADVEEVVLFEADLREGRRLGRGSQRVRLGRGSLFLSFRHGVVLR